MAGTPVIEVEGLAKSYGTFEAVRGIDLHVSLGEVVAVLGPNGAGKTTTIEILEGFRSRDGGTVRVLGQDPWKAGSAFRSRIGIVLQESGMDAYYTVSEILTMHAGWYPAPRQVNEVLSLVGLEEKRDSRVGKLSGGQKRRLDVGLGLIGDPDLLFLDEPTTGFDPTARRQAWDVVNNLGDLGKTVVLTTHYMEEAQALADRIVVLAAGRIVAEGPPDTIGGRAEAAVRITFQLPPGAAADDLPVPATVQGGLVVVESDEPTAALHALTGWALARRHELSGLTVARPSLEDIYLGLIGTADDEELA
jgi:ABC-2 type transport system ATP-binding protein